MTVENLEELLRGRCGGEMKFGDVLLQMITVRGLTQRQAGEMLSYGPPAMNKLIHWDMPRWMNFREIKRIGELLQWTDEEKKTFTNAFICEMFNSKGLQ